MKPSHGSDAVSKTKFRRWLINGLVPVLVGAGIVYYFYDKLRDPRLWDGSITLRPEWLIPAALLYLTAHVLWGSFWVSLLTRQDAGVTWFHGMRSYFVSQLGKYVPGKVWVIVIRVMMLGRIGVRRPVVGVTATFEALTSMAAGAFVAALCIPLMASNDAGLGNRIWFLIPLAMMPLGLRGLNRIAYRIAERKRQPGDPPWPWIGFWILVRGFFQACVGWVLLGVSLWMTVQGMLTESLPFEWELLAKLVAINAVAYVAGFLFLFMPAGGGVREFILQTLLAVELATRLPLGFAPGFAAVTAIVLRLIWTLAELATAAILYRFGTERIPSLSAGVPAISEAR